MNEDSQGLTATECDEDFTKYDGLTEDWGFTGPIKQEQTSQAN